MKGDGKHISTSGLTKSKSKKISMPLDPCTVFHAAGHQSKKSQLRGTSLCYLMETSAAFDGALRRYENAEREKQSRRGSGSCTRTESAVAADASDAQGSSSAQVSEVAVAPTATPERASDGHVRETRRARRLVATNCKGIENLDWLIRLCDAAMLCQESEECEALLHLCLDCEDAFQLIGLGLYNLDEAKACVRRIEADRDLALVADMPLFSG